MRQRNEFLLNHVLSNFQWARLLDLLISTQKLKLKQKLNHDAMRWTYRDSSNAELFPRLIFRTFNLNRMIDIWIMVLISQNYLDSSQFQFSQS